MFFPEFRSGPHNFGMSLVHTSVHIMSNENKRLAVAAQTARCRSQVLSIEYIYYLGPTKLPLQRQWKGRQIIR